VIADARRTLAELERGMHAHVAAPVATPAAPASPQLGLFAASPSVVERELQSMDLDAMTPREALEALYRLKSLS